MLTTENAGAFIHNAPKPKEHIMQVEITRATVANGGPQAIGTRLDLPEAEAQYLVNLGKAVTIGDSPEGDSVPAPENREAEVEKTTTTRAPKKKKTEK
jgi:hypothetical protein